jgi:hypothetical protein
MIRKKGARWEIVPINIGEAQHPHRDLWGRTVVVHPDHDTPLILFRVKLSGGD